MVMHYSQLTRAISAALAEAAGPGNFIDDPAVLEQYARDETENLRFLPAVVVRPESADAVAAILRICNVHGIPVTPRGAGTGLSGGALPRYGGVVLSTDRLNRIITIDEANLQVVTEPGVITEVLQDAVKAKGLFYPPDPSSRGSCFIGGNIAENSGGPRAVKYGVVRDYVLNLEVALPTGELIWTGANVLKNSTGYNLTQLVIGSEGTLGVVTKIVLKLLPHPTHDLLLLAPFNSLENASAAVSALFRAGHIPSALELMEIDALRIVSEHLGSTTFPVHEGIAAHLIIEVDGNDPEQLLREMESIGELLARFDCGELFFAEDAAQKAALWKLRRSVAEVVKLYGYTIEEDTVVPRAALPALIRGIKELEKEYNFRSVCYGHAGDGNLHVRIRKEGHPHSLNNPAVVPALRALFTLVRNLGGTISGEHGIGLLQKDFLDIVFKEKHLELMRGIKKVFDPGGILNPGKIFNQ